MLLITKMSNCEGTGVVHVTDVGLKGFGCKLGAAKYACVCRRIKLPRSGTYTMRT